MKALTDLRPRRELKSLSAGDENFASNGTALQLMCFRHVADFVWIIHLPLVKSPRQGCGLAFSAIKTGVAARSLTTVRT
jgi:hypothetical protein